MLSTAPEIFVPVGEHLLHLLALQILLQAAQVAGDDRKCLIRGVRPRSFLHVCQGRITMCWPSSLLQFGRHRLHLAAEEHVEEQRVDDVVAVVPQRNLGGRFPWRPGRSPHAANASTARHMVLPSGITRLTVGTCPARRCGIQRPMKSGNPAIHVPESQDASDPD